MFFRDASDTVLPSQLIRKWIAKDIGSECWDWRQYPFVENIIAIIDDIKLAMKNEKTKRKSLKYIYYITQTCFPVMALVLAFWQNLVVFVISIICFC